MRAKPSLPATILSKIAVFSALVETIKRQDRIELIRKEDVDF
jgi:hypothetical protein